MSAKKMGRPTDDPKPYRIQTRINEQEYEILTDYCKRKEKTQSQALRDGVRALKNQK